MRDGIVFVDVSEKEASKPLKKMKSERSAELSEVTVEF